MNPPGRDLPPAEPNRRRFGLRRPANEDQLPPADPARPAEPTPETGAEAPFDGTGPTTALPRPTRPPLSEQPTTALPRRSTSARPLPQSYLDPADSGSRSRPAPRPQPEPYGHQPQYGDPAYPDPAYPDPAYPDPAYPDPAYPGPVQHRSDPARPRPSAGSRPSGGQTRAGRPADGPWSDRPDSGRSNQGYSGPGHPDARYPEPQYPDVAHPDSPYPDRQDRDHQRRDSRSRDPQYRDPQYRDPQYQEPQYQEPQYQEPEDRDPQYRNFQPDPAYPDSRYQEPQYQDPQYQDPRDQDRQYRTGDRGSQGQRSRDDRRQDGYGREEYPPVARSGYQSGYEQGYEQDDYRRSPDARSQPPRPREHPQDQQDSGYRRPAPDTFTDASPGPDGYDRGYDPRDPDLTVHGAAAPDAYPAAPLDPQSTDTRYLKPPLTPEPDRRPAPRGAHLPPYREPMADPADQPTGPTRPTKTPRKLTVTRVAAMRSRELTLRGVDIFQKATTADGADRSGLAHLTYATMANYATDAALVVALANTLFLVDPKQGVWKVLLYLVITVAPFAFIAPVIGPMLDRLQTGRRLALAASMVGRSVLALLMIFTFSGTEASWALYPCALGSLVFSKSFGVLKASLTPRVLPEAITLVKTNSRLTVFGLIAGGVAGGVAGALTWLSGSPGALIFTAICGGAGAYLCLKIPAWVESTEGEVPLSTSEVSLPKSGPTVVSQSVRTTLWANSVIRIETGFLAMFIAFVVMKEYDDSSGLIKLLLLGVVGAAAGVGGFLGNALGARLTLRSPEMISVWGGVATLAATITAAFLPGLLLAAVVGLVGSTASSLAKVCLDSVIQRDLPEVSRASAFGRSETALQLAWVLGGVVGLLLGGLLNVSHDAIYTIGFVTVSLLLVVGLVQTALVRGGKSLFPALKMPGRKARAAGPSAAERTTVLDYGDAPTEYRATPPPAAPPAGPTSRMRSNDGTSKRSGGARRLPKRAKDRRSGEPL